MQQVPVDKPTENTPYWWQAAPPQRLPEQPINGSSDVVIIGAGYTGLVAALVLAEAGRDVQIFDKEQPGFGASTRNGGITSGNLRIGASDAIKAFGKQQAQAIFKEGVAAREHLRMLIENHEIDCDYQLTGRFTGAITTADLDTMSREADKLHQLTDVEPVTVGGHELSQYIGSDAYIGGIYRSDIGHFHPAKFLNGLLNAAIAKGVRVHASTPVTAIETETSSTGPLSNQDKRIVTSRGTITAADVLVATNGYTDSVDPWIRRRIVPIKSRIVATEELSRNLIETLAPQLRAMGENRNLYRYFRPSPDGKRMLFGSREPAFPVSEAKAIEHVRKGMTDIFPQLSDARIAYSWAGNVAFSRSQLPLLFQAKGIYYAMGYCGSGTVWAPWFGRKVAEAILDSTAALSDVSALAGSAPGGIPLYRGQPWFLPAAMLWHGMQDKLKGR